MTTDVRPVDDAPPAGAAPAPLEWRFIRRDLDRLRERWLGIRSGPCAGTQSMPSPLPELWKGAASRSVLPSMRLDTLVAVPVCASARLRFRLTALLSTGFQLTLPLDDSERDPLARRSA